MLQQGAFVVSPQPNSKDLIARMLKLMLDKEDKERAFVHFNAGDSIVLLVNNMGGMSVLEMYAIVDEALEQLGMSSSLELLLPCIDEATETEGIFPARVFCGPFTTSLNAPGFSLSLLNLTSVSQATSSSIDTLLELVDAPHSSAAWQTSTYPAPGNLASRKRTEKFVDVPAEAKAKEEAGPTLPVDPEYLQKILKAGAEAVLASEPDLTKWDTVSLPFLLSLSQC